MRQQIREWMAQENTPLDLPLVLVAELIVSKAPISLTEENV